jgi:hypothetical protein
MGTRQRIRLSESLHRAYGEWEWRTAAVWAAYERWGAATGEREQGVEFASYHVALDQEEDACRRLRELTSQAA